MSRPTPRNTPSTGADGPPFVGALLRMCVKRIRTRIDAAIRQAGFDDLQETHLRVFSYPLPDGVRPSELARHLGMSRQATNHVIAQMEALGYLERRAADGERRLVHFTPRAWGAVEVIYAESRKVQAEWAEEIGPDRFHAVVDTLRLIAAEELVKVKPRPDEASDAG
jgi:DNA-binding MarR family transcriptional regulator